MYSEQHGSVRDFPLQPVGVDCRNIAVDATPDTLVIYDVGGATGHQSRPIRAGGGRRGRGGRGGCGGSSGRGGNFNRGGGSGLPRGGGRGGGSQTPQGGPRPGGSGRFPSRSPSPHHRSSSGSGSGSGHVTPSIVTPSHSPFPSRSSRVAPREAWDEDNEKHQVSAHVRRMRAMQDDILSEESQASMRQTFALQTGHPTFDLQAMQAHPEYINPEDEGAKVHLRCRQKRLNRLAQQQQKPATITQPPAGPNQASFGGIQSIWEIPEDNPLQVISQATQKQLVQAMADDGEGNKVPPENPQNG